MSRGLGLAAAIGLGIPVASLALWWLLAPSTDHRARAEAPAAAPERVQQAPLPPRPTEPPSSLPAASLPEPNQPAPVGPTQPATEQLYFEQLEQLRRTDKLAALRYAEQGDRWYPATGRPAEARHAMAVTLLVELDRMPEARARTRRFLVDHPGSPYAHLIQGQTGIHPRPGPPPGVASP